jgi:hypothetical protein
MKKLIVLVILPLLMLGSARVFADEDWNIQIKTDDGPPTIPFDSTGLLSLENFSVSSLGSISDLAYNASISRAKFPN